MRAAMEPTKSAGRKPTWFARGMTTIMNPCFVAAYAFAMKRSAFDPKPLIALTFRFRQVH